MNILWQLKNTSTTLLHQYCISRNKRVWTGLDHSEYRYNTNPRELEPVKTGCWSLVLVRKYKYKLTFIPRCVIKEWDLTLVHEKVELVIKLTHKVLNIDRDKYHVAAPHSMVKDLDYALTPITLRLQKRST